MSTDVLRAIAGRHELADLFQSLVRQWKSRKDHTSSAQNMAMDFAYQRIIGLGPDAVPLILRELEREPDHWFWALTAITGQNPVPERSRGKIPEMTKAWLQWGREQGIAISGVLVCFHARVLQ